MTAVLSALYRRFFFFFAVEQQRRVVAPIFPAPPHGRRNNTIFRYKYIMARLSSFQIRAQLSNTAESCTYVICKAYFITAILMHQTRQSTRGRDETDFAVATSNATR